MQEPKPQLHTSGLIWLKTWAASACLMEAEATDVDHFPTKESYYLGGYIGSASDMLAKGIVNHHTLPWFWFWWQAILHT